MKTVEELMRKTFDTPRDPRSDEYKAGVRAVLNFRINVIPVVCRYDTLVQQDAFSAGCEEGHRIANYEGIPHRRRAIS